MEFMQNWNIKQKLSAYGGAFLAFLIIAGLLYRALFLTFVDGHEIGYEYNMQTGKIRVLDRTGYFSVMPFYTAVYAIDGRPTQVRVEANGRVVNAKLVRFHKSERAVMEFVMLHGLDDYKMNTNSSTTTSQKKGDLADILMSYAYLHFAKGTYKTDEEENDALQQEYPFLEIMLSTDINTPSGKKKTSVDIPPISKDTLK